MSGFSNADPALPEKLANLIAEGKTAEALLLLFEAGYQEAIPLKAQLDTANAQFEGKRIGFEAWSLIQNRINYAILQEFRPNSVTPKKIKTEKPGPAPHAKIRALIAQNQTAEAIELCRNLGEHYILLKARFVNLKKYVNLDLVPFSVAAEIQTHINEAVLKIMLEARDAEPEPLVPRIISPQQSVPEAAQKPGFWSKIIKFIAFR